MTVHCWGERAAGEWTLEIHDTPSQVRNPAVQGKGPPAPMSPVPAGPPRPQSSLQAASLGHNFSCEFYGLQQNCIAQIFRKWE